MYTVTITAANGPGLTATAIVLTDVTSILYDWIGLIVTIYRDGSPSPLMFSLSGVTTITTTPASNAITIS